MAKVFLGNPSPLASYQVRPTLLLILIQYHSLSHSKIKIGLAQIQHQNEKKMTYG
jgi:hypothetical protein